MMDWARSSLEQVEATRLERLNQRPPVLDEAGGERLLNEYHPDRTGYERQVTVGANAGGQLFPQELADLLEADSLLPEGYRPSVELETDVLILGGGGAGASAALALEGSGLRVHLATKLRLGDSNTIMAEGGMQAAVGPGDSPRRHFADACAGGHGANDPVLLRCLCERGADAVRRLSGLGCLFDRNPDGTFRLRSGGGTSAPRVLACRDYTGLEIMRVLRNAVELGGTRVLPHHSAVELLDDGDGRVTGAVLWNSANGGLLAVSARAVLLATGGSGRLHLQGYPTSNHLGATGDGLVLAYRQGCALVHADSFQYHPSGAIFPEALVGQLVTESIRSVGAQLLNSAGRRFVDEMTYRDIVAAAIIREVVEHRGVKTPAGRYGVWLDTPMIESQRGAGTLRAQFPGIIHRFERYGIDPARMPILVYPTLHYQNGGIRIDAECRTDAPGLWAAGEVAGGIHGINRLMGNSLLDVIVFGERAAESIRARLPDRGPLTLRGLEAFREQLRKIGGHRQRDLRAPRLFPAESGRKFAVRVS